MATLADLPKVIRKTGLVPFLRRVTREVSDDNLLVWAAALAYSWLFAAFPFFLFLLSLLPYLPERTKTVASDQVHQLVYDSLPKQAADTIWLNVQEVLSHKRTGLLSVGLALAIWGASGGMNMTLSSLTQCYEIRDGRSLIKHRLLAVTLTIVVAVLLLAVLTLLPIGTFIIHWLGRHTHIDLSRGMLWIWSMLRYPVALVAMFMIVTILYHFGPAIRHRFVLVSPGAVFCVLVWILQGLFVRAYVEHFSNFNQTYGAVGGAAILLLVFYIDAVVLLVGEEINSEIDFAILDVPRGTRDFISPARSGSAHSLPSAALPPGR